MFERLKNLVLPGLKNSASEIDEADSETTVALAAAMLLLEVAWADHEIEALGHGGSLLRQKASVR